MFERVREGRLADFALEGFPHVGVHGPLVRCFLDHSGLEPFAEALEVQETDGSVALAGRDQRVLDGRLLAPTEFAVLVFLLPSHFDVLRLLQLLLPQLFFAEVRSLSPAVLYPELDTTQLDGVELVDLVRLKSDGTYLLAFLSF